MSVLNGQFKIYIMYIWKMDWERLIQLIHELLLLKKKIEP